MYIKLTRMNGQPIWLNASFVVTIEPAAHSGGAIVVPIGDGLDYEVREPPETVLALLSGAPAPAVVPVPPPRTLTPQPDDVSPETERTASPEPEKAATDAKPAKKTSRRKKKVEKEALPAEDLPDPEGFKEIMAGLKERKCRTEKRLRNAIKSFFKKTDDAEIDHIIETMINKGYMSIGANGHVTWEETSS